MPKPGTNPSIDDTPSSTKPEAKLYETPQSSLEAFGRAQAEFVRQMEVIQREIMESWRQQAHATQEMTRECTHHPQESPRILISWFTHQIESAIEQNRRISHHWLNLLQESVNQTQNISEEVEEKVMANMPLPSTSAPERKESLKSASAG